MFELVRIWFDLFHNLKLFVLISNYSIWIGYARNEILRNHLQHTSFCMLPCWMELMKILIKNAFYHWFIFLHGSTYLVCFYGGLQRKKWLLSMLHQALKIVSNWLSSVKQDRNYFNPKARWVQKSIKSV